MPHAEVLLDACRKIEVNLNKYLLEKKTSISVDLNMVSDPSKITASSNNKSDLWSHVWGSSVILSELLLNLDGIKEYEVLELGAGTGLCSKVCGMLCSRVVSTDFHPTSVDIIRLNCPQNVHAVVHNWHDPVPGDFIQRFNMIIGSDVIYMGNSVSSVNRTIKDCMKNDGFSIIVDPGRPNREEFMGKCLDNGMHVWSKHVENVGAEVCNMKLCCIIIVSWVKNHPMIKVIDRIMTDIERHRCREAFEEFGYCSHVSTFK